MSIEIYLPVISQLMGRDITPDYQMLIRARNAVGSTLNEQGQIYLTKNWRSFVEFMETTEGQDSIKMMIDMWIATKTPPSITAPDAHVPAQPTPQENPPPTLDKDKLV